MTTGIEWRLMGIYFGINMDNWLVDVVVSTYPSEKYELVNVSWDDEIPNWMESHNPVMFQTTNQINYEKLELKEKIWHDFGCLEWENGCLKPTFTWGFN